MTENSSSETPHGGLGQDRIPAGYTSHKRTPTFDYASVPDGLKAAHATKAGVWGLIVVEKGEVHYTIDKTSDEANASFTLTPDVPGVVAPTELHHVRLEDDDTRFHVEFYRAAAPTI